MFMQKLLSKGLYVVAAGLVFSSFTAVSGARADATCGVNLFNPMLLTEADFIESNGVYSGKWNGYLNNYVSNYPFNFIPGKAYKVVYTLDCSNPDAGKAFFGLRLEGGEVVGPGRDVCNGSDSSVTVSFTGGGTSGNDVKAVVVSGLNNGALPESEIKISNVMVVLGNVESDEFIRYEPCITIATTDSLQRRVTGVNNRLTTVNGLIDTLITNNTTNTTGIGSLASAKQDRPVRDCPSGKKCLLVKDTNNQDNWYPIVDCELDSFWGGISGLVSTPSVYSGATSSFGYNYNGTAAGTVNFSGANDDASLCRASGVNCGNNEWVTNFDKGLVYGRAKRVPIAQNVPGQIVALDNNVASGGNVCVCQVTGYRELNDGTYGTRQNYNAGDKWMVVGTMPTNPSDEQCLFWCSVGYEYYFAVANSYFGNIGNTCSAAARSATMCEYHTFLDTVYSTSVSQPHNAGMVATDDEGQGGCATGGVFADNPVCSVPGTWISQYVSSGNSSTVVGYVYGTSGYATVPNGTVAGSVVDLDVSSISSTGNGHNAIVCFVQGYKANAAASETTVSFSRAFVERVGDMTNGNIGVSARDCMDVFSLQGYTGYEAAMNWYHELANMCIAQ